jgi:mono/diheme cytochrome c family protein
MTKLGFGALALAIAAIPLANALAADEAAAPKLDAGQIDRARTMFTDNGCIACHTLADAHAAGTVGPAFDGNANLTKEFAVDRITNGQGAMPSFGWLPPEDIDLLASYIVEAKK